MPTMIRRMRRLGFAIAALVLGAGCASSSGAMVGKLHSAGGELGDFDFSPTRCVYRQDLGNVVDLTDAHHPGVVVRVNVKKPGALIANTRAASGAREVAFTPGAGCTYHFGFDRVLTHVFPSMTFQTRIGLRLDCATPAGGRVSGVIGAGACR